MQRLKEIKQIATKMWVVRKQDPDKFEKELKPKVEDYINELGSITLAHGHSQKIDTVKNMFFNLIDLSAGNWKYDGE